MSTPLNIIDTHTHVFPSAETGEQWQSQGGHQPDRAGTAEELGRLMELSGVSRSVILLFLRSGVIYDDLVRRSAGSRSDPDIRAEVADGIRRLNRWGCELAAADDRFIPMIGINVRFMEPSAIRAEIDEMVAAGAKGVKIIPPSMRVYGNDPLLFPVYARCAELGLPVLSQSGSGGGDPPSPGADHFGRPRYFRDVLQAHPGLTLILAHLGLGYEEDVVELARDFPNVYADTSMRFGGPADAHRPKPDLVRTMRRIGTDRVIFGTNFPVTDPLAYVRVLRELPLTDEERRRIASDNLERALRI